MSDQPPRTGDDPELLRALRDLAADYEPDVAAIGRRVQEIGQTRAIDRTHLSHRPRLVSKARPAPVVQHGRLVLLPAAAVLLLVGGIVLATSAGGPDPDSGETSALPIATAFATQPPAPATAVEPRNSATSPQHSSPTRTASRTPTSDATPGTAAPGRVDVSVQPLSSAATGTAVELGGPELIDWLAVGTRADLKQVRAKDRAANPVLAVEQPGSATSVVGPFSTSWTAGLPEQSHDRATDWLMADGRSGLTMTLIASSRPRILLLYAGTRDLRGTLSISGKGLASQRTALGAASRTAQGLVITVSLPPATGQTVIRLNGSPDGPTPKVYLAALTVAPLQPR